MSDLECEWCGEAFGLLDYGGGLRHCSTDCKNAAIRYAAKVLEAYSNDEEPPTEAEFKAMQERSRRWTPERMADRIEELREMGAGVG